MSLNIAVKLCQLQNTTYNLSLIFWSQVACSKKCHNIPKKHFLKEFLPQLYCSHGCYSVKNGATVFSILCVEDVWTLTKETKF